MSNALITEERLQAYVDGQASPAEQIEIERHLARHPEDAERIAAYQRQRELLRSAYAGVLDESVPARLRGPRNPVQPAPALRIAAIIGWLALGALVGWGLRGHQEQAHQATSREAELVQRARLAHVIYTAERNRAVEVAASQEQAMIRWLSNRMGTAVRVPKLAEFGFEALGGRLLPGTAGPACQIMYQNAAGKRLTIYLARDPVRSAQPLRFSDGHTVHVVFWTDGTLAFAVSGEIEQQELKRIAEAIARAAKS